MSAEIQVGVPPEKRTKLNDAETDKTDAEKSEPRHPNGAGDASNGAGALWSGTTKNQDCGDASNGAGDAHNGAKENALDQFEIVRVLNHLRERRCIFLLAKEKGKEAENAIIKLEKTPFEEDIKGLNRVCSSEVSSSLEFNNDIYSNLVSTPLSASLIQDLGSVKTSLIHPASEKHIAKYLAQELYFVSETAADYEAITLPCLKADQFSFQWIFNILDHKSEVDRIVFEDPDPNDGFILLPDMKWNGGQVTELYCTAIVHRRGIMSIRDLRARHLPLLRNIRDQATKAILDKYGVPGSQLVAYFHYQPSYYHLHVHFTHVAFEAPGRDTSGAHVLQTVIDNLERDGKFYARCTLPFKLKAQSELYRKYREAGKL